MSLRGAFNISVPREEEETPGGRANLYSWLMADFTAGDGFLESWSNGETLPEGSAPTAVVSVDSNLIVVSVSSV